MLGRQGLAEPLRSVVRRGTEPELSDVTDRRQQRYHCLDDLAELVYEIGDLRRVRSHRVPDATRHPTELHQGAPLKIIDFEYIFTCPFVAC